jgi:hypothetical protein
MDQLTVTVFQKDRYIVADLSVDYKFTPLECRLIDKIAVCKDSLLQLVWERVNLWFYPDNKYFYLKKVTVGSVGFSMVFNGKYTDVTVSFDKLLVVSNEILRVLENKLASVVLYMKANGTAGLPGSKYKCHKTIIESLRKLQHWIDSVNKDIQPKQLFSQ